MIVELVRLAAGRMFRCFSSPNNSLPIVVSKVCVVSRAFVVSTLCKKACRLIAAFSARLFWRPFSKWFEAATPTDAVEASS